MNRSPVRFLIGLLFVVLTVGGGCSRSIRVGRVRDPARVTRENFDRVTDRMPLAEVENILGLGDDVGEADARQAWRGLDLPAGLQWKRWRGAGEDPAVILLGFENGQVSYRHFDG